MTSPLGADRTSDRIGQPVVQLIARRAAAQDLTHVELVEREQAGAELALSRQSHPVAVVTERLGDAGNDTDMSAAVEVSIALGRLIGSPDGLGREHLRDRRQDLVCGHHHCRRPDVTGLERHELDKADFDIALPSEPGKVDDLVIVDAAHHDGVDLGRREPGVNGCIDAVENSIQLVPPGQLKKPVTLQRVEADVDA